MPVRYLNRKLPFRLQQARRRVNTSPHSRADMPVLLSPSCKLETGTPIRSGKLQNQRAEPLIFIVLMSLSLIARSHPRVPGGI